MSDTPPPIRVNRAPVLTLWATVVAERLGYPPKTALSLGRFVAGSSARAKARRLGIIEETQEAEERRARAAELKPRPQTVHLLGRDIPVLAADDGTLRAEDDGKPASSKSVQSYIARAFGDRLGEARAAMEALAASLPPEELNRVGFRLYERFRSGKAVQVDQDRKAAGRLTDGMGMEFPACGTTVTGKRCHQGCSNSLPMISPFSSISCALRASDSGKTP